MFIDYTQHPWNGTHRASCSYCPCANTAIRPMEAVMLPNGQPGIRIRSMTMPPWMA